MQTCPIKAIGGSNHDVYARGTEKEEGTTIISYE